MATATQLMPSPTTASHSGLKSAFSPYTDSPASPASPAPFARVFSTRSSTASDHLQPPPSPYPSTVDPSPVDSNGTSGTEIEEDDAQMAHASEDEGSDIHIKSPLDDDVHPPSRESHALVGPTMRASDADPARGPQPSRLDTSLPVRSRADSDDAPQSVIHAPDSFKAFSRPSVSVPPPNETASDHTAVVSPQTPEANMIPDEKHSSTYTHPIDTAVPASAAPERSTPRAQTRHDFEEDGKRRSARVSVSLADIAETEDLGVSETSSSSTFENENSQMGSLPNSESPLASMSASASASTQTMGEVLHGINETEKEIAALRNALHECWTLCNSLAKLSQNHRLKMFYYSGPHGEVQQLAWRTCWRLCQQLYESRDEEPTTEIKPTLELCRAFCQALFDVRSRGDEVTDSVLRVSFELNNHLYNAHDRSLPEAFQERTLEFYLTLCHRLMKQSTSLPEETDALLHACWSLAEMLFSIRQNSRDNKPADEEIFGSAIQACWELCDLFREGWTQVRPERGTPRPSQYTFTGGPASVAYSQTTYSDTSGRSSSLNESYHSAVSVKKQLLMNPETPTTIFDEREDFSPAEEPNIPNILILGPEAGQTRTHDRWSSTSSNLSTYSDTSQSIHSSSTATAGREDPNLIRLKGLIVKAAINAGYSRHTPLPEFVRSLPSNSFGNLPWQGALFESYKHLVLTDPTLRNIHTQPLRRLTASEIGRAVQWMARSKSFNWMSDLYRFVFGSFPEDSGQRNLIINA